MQLYAYLIDILLIDGIYKSLRSEEEYSSSVPAHRSEPIKINDSKKQSITDCIKNRDNLHLERTRNLIFILEAVVIGDRMLHDACRARGNTKFMIY